MADNFPDLGEEDDQVDEEDIVRYYFFKALHTKKFECSCRKIMVLK